jgi:FtsP/CotA-like multicopper oxidase with cupredoxin domain
MSQLVGRRAFLKAAGVAAATAASGIAFNRVLMPRPGPLQLAVSGGTIKRYHIAATDGWVSMPAQANPIPPFWPDPDAAVKAPYTVVNGKETGMWVMGFRDVTELGAYDQVTGTYPLTAEIESQKGKAQLAAPLLYARVGDDLRLHLSNLGLEARPDLVDSHTIHFHGFPNQTAYFDGVPDASLAASIGRTLVYRYIPEDPGTYMYHCHFEDVEHVHMGLTGLVFIYPKSSARPGEANYDVAAPNPYKFAYDTYNGVDNPTGFDREFAFIITEADIHDHYNDAHLQINDFSALAPTFRLMNGRAWPDTVEPNVDPFAAKFLDGSKKGQAAGRLQYNPLSSLLQANSGERVLIRISNLGYEEHSFVLPGIPMHMIGRDAKPLFNGRPDYLENLPAPGQAYGAGSRGDITVVTNRFDIGPGESRDLIFMAPTVAHRTVFPFYDRNENFVHNDASVSGDGYAGARTELHVFPSGTLAPQTLPSQLLAANGAM